MGGRLYRCKDCGYETNIYNSCTSRHCPTCQGFQQEAWSEARKAELLPVTYFHNVFTLPHEFNPVALRNKQLVYDLLFQAVKEILLELGQDRLHGLLGLILSPSHLGSGPEDAPSPPLHHSLRSPVLGPSAVEPSGVRQVSL